MKQDIHPKTQMISAKCACGAVFNIESTLSDNLELEVCSQCHPFYTGKQNIIDTAGRLDKFKERQAKTEQLRKVLPQKDEKGAKEQATGQKLGGKVSN